MRLRDIHIRTRFVILGVVFLVGYAILIASSATLLGRVMINGELYGEVTNRKDLVADVLPPPKYIVDPYLVSYQIATTTDAGERVNRINHVRRLIDEYKLRQTFWENQDLPRELRESLLEQSHQPAAEFFRVLEQEFFQAARSPETSERSPLEILETRLTPLFLEHRQAIQRTVQLAKAEIKQKEATAAEAVARGKRWMTIIAGVYIALMVLLSFFVIRSILVSLAKINERTRALAEADADLSARIPIDSKDEVGELAHWFNAFIQKIAGLVTAAKRSSIQLTTTATEMAATSHEQEETVRGFGASTNRIAAAVREISATSSELMTSMDEISRLSQSSASIAASGRSDLSTMESTMQTLADSSASISAKLSVINEKANDITSVVTTITKVADQTNLLSVNAAIEAEKSGEYGRGFLVVAREIRRLADQTSGATLHIESTVHEMQSAVSSGVMEMDKFTEQVRRSVEEVQRISQKLAQIIAEVEQTTDRFGGVSTGMASQTEGASQISEAMTSLVDGVQQTGTSLQEFTSAAEDMKKAVESLKAELTRFKLGD